MNQKFISVIVPAFNEEENVSVLINRLHDVLRHEGTYEIVVVDDGSTDNTLFVVQQLSEDNPAVRYLSFSRNYGHQMALRAGYDHARGDCVISLDADLQHPPEFIPILLDHWRRGFEVVHTIRQTDPHLSWFKRASSRWFYRLLRSVSNLDLADGTADFCLLDRKVVDSLKQFKETDLFLRASSPGSVSGSAGWCINLPNDTPESANTRCEKCCSWPGPESRRSQPSPSTFRWCWGFLCRLLRACSAWKCCTKNILPSTPCRDGHPLCC